MEININEFAEEHGIDLGALLLSIIKYLVPDPREIPSNIRLTLIEATDEDINDALETIRDDLRRGSSTSD